MARLPRLSLPEIPQHVIQRGNNRSACFFAEDDYRYYLDCLQDAAERYGVAVHAYVPIKRGQIYFWYGSTKGDNKCHERQGSY